MDESIVTRSARLAALLLALSAAPLLAQGTPMAGSVTTYLEKNAQPGDEDVLRLPVMFAFDLGSPRTSQFLVEPSAGWHSVGGTTDASGFSYTRLRGYHYFGGHNRFTWGPDVEIFLKTESDVQLGFGTNIIMPGFNLGYRLSPRWKVNLRTRFEFTGGEDPGVASRKRITFRPTLFFPPVGRFSSWIRSDFTTDLENGSKRYNVEANATLKVDPHQRLAVVVWPRIYLGETTRASNLWRLRAGLQWSLGSVMVGHGTHTNDLRALPEARDDQE